MMDSPQTTCLSFITQCITDPEINAQLREWGTRVLNLAEEARENRAQDESVLRDLLEFAQSRRDNSANSVFEVAEEAYQALSKAREEHEKMVNDCVYAVAQCRKNLNLARLSRDQADLLLAMCAVVTQMEEDLYARYCVHTDLHFDSPPEALVSALALCDSATSPAIEQEQVLAFLLGHSQIDPRES